MGEGSKRESRAQVQRDAEGGEMASNCSMSTQLSRLSYLRQDYDIPDQEVSAGAALEPSVMQHLHAHGSRHGEHQTWRRRRWNLVS